MKKKSDKLLFLVLVFICIVLAIFFTFIAINATYGIQKLSSEEISQYTQYAENLWNNEATFTTECFQHKRTENSITVASYNMFKQTVTVSFAENTHEVTINEPNICFTGCAIFFFVLGGINIIAAILFTIAIIDEFRKNKKKSQKSRE